MKSLNIIRITLLELTLIATTISFGQEFKSGKNDVTFIAKTMAGDLNLAGHLYLPQNFDASKKYPTIVFNGPILQVKEQMGAVYGKKFSEQGYVFLTFDHSGFGDSEGLMRSYDNTGIKVNDTHNAVSYLRTLPFVDENKLYGIGGCMGANTMAYTVLTSKRFTKVAFVSGMLANTTALYMDKENEKS